MRQLLPLLLVLCCVAPGSVSAQAGSRDYIRLISAYRLRQFQETETAHAPPLALPPLAVDRRLVRHRLPSWLSHRVTLPIPGPLQLSVAGRLGSFGPGSSIRLLLPLRFP